jgi:putative inorganic carbon (HCO3(-)) transporter
VPLAAALAVRSRLPLRVALSGAIALFLVAIFLTYSRGGFLGLLAVLGLMGWKLRSPVLRLAMVAGLVLVIIAAGAFWARKDSFADIRSDTTFNQRIATIKAGTLMFLDRPLFGVGPGNSLVGYPLYVPEEYHCGCQTQLVIHNAFFQVMSEMGALGLLPWLVFIGMGIVHARQLQKTGDAVYPAALELALWGFVVCSLAGGFAYTWFPYLLVGLVVGAKRIAEENEGR